MEATAPWESDAAMAADRAGHSGQAGVEGGQVEGLEIAGLGGGGQVLLVEAISSVVRASAWWRALSVAVVVATSAGGGGSIELALAGLRPGRSGARLPTGGWTRGWPRRRPPRPDQHGHARPGPCASGCRRPIGGAGPVCAGAG